MGHAQRLLSWTLALAAAACGGGGGGAGGGGGTGPPAGLSYPNPSPSYRVATSAPPNTPTVSGATPMSFSVTPDLPAGLSLDAGTGAITGAPVAASATDEYVVTATNDLGWTDTPLSIQVTPALPSGVLSLASGFAIERRLTGLSMPVKIAFAPDGRLFFNEKGGATRIVSGGTLLPTPFSQVTVVNFAEQGLLGLAIPPDFATTGDVFVYATVPASGGDPDRNQVIRFTAVGDTGTNPTVVVDDLPAGLVHNAGGIEIGPDDRLYVSVGDTGTDTLAQTDGSLAGRILRYARDGSVPADNPIAGSPEWARGLRNSYDMTFHAATGGLFASENGPAAQDELNFLQRAKNYGWPSLPGNWPGNLVGFAIRSWTPVIAPTGVAFVTGGVFGPGFDDNLFVGGYVDAEVRRLVLSGAALTDLDSETVFLRFVDSNGTDKPLDLVLGPDGALWISTFDSIWRVSRYP